MIPRTVLQRVLAHRRILHSEGVVAGAWLTMRGRTGGPRGGQAWVFRPLAVTHEKGAAKLVSAMDVAGPGARMMSSGAGGRVTFSRKHPEWNSMHQKLQAGDINGVLASFMKLKKEGVACLLVYNMVLAAHARVRAADDALDLFEEIEANADRLGGPDQHSVSALANALCRAGRLNAACDLVERMRAVGVAPNINVYNVLLSGTVLPRQVGVAQAILKKMAHDGIIGDEFTLIARIRLAARLGNAAEVTATWRDAVGGLISANMPCSRASISCLAVSYAKCSRPDLAEGALRVIVRLSAGDGGKVRGVLPAELYEAAGIEAPPCVAGDGEGGSGGEEVWKGQPTSLRECGGGSGGGPAGRETDAASEWGHDDYKKHILSAFNSTMAAYNKQGHVPGVRAVQEMLLSVGVPPELSTQNAHMRSDEAIQVVLGDDATTQEESALQRLEKWLANRVGSTQSTGRSKQHKDSMVCAINMAMIVAEKLNGVEGIMQLWPLFGKHGLRQDVISWTIRMEAYATRHDVNGAWDVFNIMRKVGITPHEKTWVSLIAAHRKSKRYKKWANERVMEVISVLKTDNVPVNVRTGTALMHVLGQLGMDDELYNIFEMVRRCGEPMGAFTYNVVMKNIADRELGAPAGVRLLFEMISDGVEPDSITYNSLINTCIVPDHLGLANFFLAFQSSAGVNCQADSFNVTLKSCILANDIGAAMDILNDMEDMGVAATRGTFETLLRAFRENPDLPISEINWMLEKAVLLGGRPAPDMIIEVIECCEDVRQSTFFLGMCLRNHLLPPSKIMRLAEKVHGRLGSVQFDTFKGQEEAGFSIKRVLSEARAAMVGRFKTFTPAVGN